jgi:hypothetical protein
VEVSRILCGCAISHRSSTATGVAPPHNQHRQILLFLLPISAGFLWSGALSPKGPSGWLVDEPLMQNIKQQLTSIYRNKQKQTAKNAVFVLLQKNTKYASNLYLILQRVGGQ